MRFSHSKHRFIRGLALSVLLVLSCLSMGSAPQKAAPERSVIWIGDSRCVGIKRTCAIRSEDCFIAEGEKSYRWFMGTAIPQLRSYLNKDPNQIVIIMIGVNDCFNQSFGAMESYSAYAPVINDLIDQYPDTIFCFCSVNPVDERFGFTRTYGQKTLQGDMDSFNTIVESFNAYLKENSRAYYIDSYHYLLEQGFETIDGIHYSKETYERIYSFCLQELVHPLTAAAMQQTVSYLSSIVADPD